MQRMERMTASRGLAKMRFRWRSKTPTMFSFIFLVAEPVRRDAHGLSSRRPSSACAASFANRYGAKYNMCRHTKMPDWRTCFATFEGKLTCSCTSTLPSGNTDTIEPPRAPRINLLQQVRIVDISTPYEPDQMRHAWACG